MIVVFLRHAQAGPAVSGDFGRKLTPKGLDQADRVGRHCARLGLVPDVILTSPVVRARQTAELVAERLDGMELRHAPWLACGMDPPTCAQELAALAECKTVFLVGHEPDFSMTIEWFLGAPHGAVHVRKASLIGLDISAFKPGSASMEFLIPAQMLP